MTGFPRLGDPALRMLAGLMLLLGAYNAAAYPYLSLIALRDIGISGGALAGLTVLASVVAVGASVAMGVVADRWGNPRRLAILTASAQVLGMALMLLAPGPLALLVSHGLLVPVGWALYGQAFGLAGARLAARPMERDGLQAAIRACLSFSFLAMMLALAWAFRDGFAMRVVYGAGLAMALANLALVVWRWPADAPRGQVRGPGPLASLGQILRVPVLIRLACLGAMLSAGTVYMLVVSLVFAETPGRGASDAAIYVGMIAGWEVPLMIWGLPLLVGRIRRSTLIALGLAVYVSHLALMPFLAGTPLVWVLPLLGGAGGAVTLSLPIGYVQDLMGSRAGATVAMIALQKLVTDVTAAAVFALGMPLGGTAAVAVMSSAVALIGAAGLMLADRNRAPGTAV